jgi:predicted nucleotidyltransferase
VSVKRRGNWSAEQRDRLVEAAPKALSRLPQVVSAYLFGSGREPGMVGDIDVALFVQPGATLSTGDMGRLTRELAEAVGPGCPEIDVRIVRPNMAALAHEVLRTGLQLYEADAAERAWIEARLESLYLDERWLATLAAAEAGGGADAAP